MFDPLAALSRLSIPLGVITTLLGGSAWLTTTHNKVESIEKDLKIFSADYHEQKDRLFDKVNNQDSRLSNIEGKLDILIENMWRKNAKNSANNPNR